MQFTLWWLHYWESSKPFSTWALGTSAESTSERNKKDRLTTFKDTFPINQSIWKKCNSSDTELSDAPFSKNWALFVSRSSYAHSWATSIMCCMCLNNLSAFFTCQAGSHCPMGNGSTQSLSLRIDSGCRRGALLATSDLVPLDYPAAVSKPRPVTYRPNINDSGSILSLSPPPPSSFGNLNQPPSTALLHKTNGFGCSSSYSRILGQPNHTNLCSQAGSWQECWYITGD